MAAYETATATATATNPRRRLIAVAAASLSAVAAARTAMTRAIWRARVSLRVLLSRRRICPLLLMLLMRVSRRLTAAR